MANLLCTPLREVLIGLVSPVGHSDNRGPGYGSYCDCDECLLAPRSGGAHHHNPNNPGRSLLDCLCVGLEAGNGRHAATDAKVAPSNAAKRRQTQQVAEAQRANLEAVRDTQRFTVGE